jgi:hypothetical protein
MLFAIKILIKNKLNGQCLKTDWAKKEPDFTKRATGTKEEMNRFAGELWDRLNPEEKGFINYEVCELVN